MAIAVDLDDGFPLRRLVSERLACRDVLSSRSYELEI